MRCQWVLGEKECNKPALLNGNFCVNHSPKLYRAPDLDFNADKAFIGRSEKITDEDRKRIDGYYKSQHPKPKKIVPKPTEPPVAHETPKERIDVLSQPITTIRELSQYLKVSMLTIKRWEQKGKIKSIRINSRGDRRYLKEEIQRFLGQT